MCVVMMRECCLSVKIYHYLRNYCRRFWEMICFMKGLSFKLKYPLFSINWQYFGSNANKMRGSEIFERTLSSMQTSLEWRHME